MMERWFGKSWGAPCCEAEAHAPTPVGQRCLRCAEPIKDGDLGVMRFVLRSMGPGGFGGSWEPECLECVLHSVRPHGPECPHCRGADRLDHDAECGYRQRGDLCSCRPMPEAT